MPFPRTHPGQRNIAQDVWLVRVRLFSQPRVFFNLVFVDYGEAMHALRVISGKVGKRNGRVVLRWRG